MAQSYPDVEAWIWTTLQRQVSEPYRGRLLDPAASFAELQVDSFGVLTLVIDFCQAFRLDFEHIAQGDFRIHTVADLLSYARVWLEDQK